MNEYFQPGLEAWQAAILDRKKRLKEELSDLASLNRPITLEIGSGHGHFLAAYAAAHPDQCCIGVDRIADRIRRAIRKGERHELRNLRFIRADAMEFLETLPPEICFQRIFVLFPDPWPKKRHHKNRLLSDLFLKELADRSPPSAHLYFRTDYLPYFQEVAERLENQGRWKTLSGAEWPFEYRTVFQERAESFYSLVAEVLPPKDFSEKIERENNTDLEKKRDCEQTAGEDKKRIKSLPVFPKRPG